MNKVDHVLESFDLNPINDTALDYLDADMLISEAIDLKALAKKAGENIKAAWRWIVRSIKYLWSCIMRRMKSRKAERLIQEADKILESEGYAVYDFNNIPGDDYEGMFEADQMAILGDYTEGDLKALAKRVLTNKKMILKVGKMFCPGVGTAVLMKNAAKAVVTMTPIITDFITTTKEIALLKRKYAGKTKRVKNADGTTYCELPSEAYITIDKYIKLGNRILQFLTQGGKKETVEIQLRNTDELIKFGKKLYGEIDRAAAKMADDEEINRVFDKILIEYEDSINAIKQENGGNDELVAVKDSTINALRNNRTYGNYISEILTFTMDAAANMMQVYVNGEEYRIDGKKCADLIAPILSECTGIFIQIVREMEEMERLGLGCIEMFIRLMGKVLPSAAKVGLKMDKYAQTINRNDMITKVKKESSGNLVDTVIESFNFDPLSDYISESDSTPQMYEDGQQFLEDAIKEASSDVNKKNIFQKLLGLIRKLINWCSRQWVKIVTFFKKAVLKKAPKTTDQLCIEMGIPPKVAAEKYGASQRVQIPNDSNENDLDEYIDLVFKPLQISYTDDKNTIEFNFKTILLKNLTGIGQGNIKGARFDSPRPGSFSMAVEMIKDSSKRDSITQLCRMVQSNQLTNDFNNRSKEIVDWFGRAMNQDSDPDNKKFTVQINQLVDFQSWLSNMDQLLTSIESPNTEIKTDGNYPYFGYNTMVINYLNSLSAILMNLQMTMNAITASISNAYMIDASYYGAISSIEVLGKFVKKCIDSGMPRKYLSYNAYLISDRSIRGEMSDARHPSWGQSRVVFFPHGNESVVYKIALNGWGLRANYSELEISNAIKDAGGADLIALANSITEENAVLTAERIGSISMFKVKMDELSTLKDNISDITSKAGIPHDVTRDILQNNVGIKNGHLAALDYGMTSRTTLKAQRSLDIQ